MMLGSEVQGKGVTPVVEFSFLEVYNEKVYDLLGDHKQCDLVVRSENSTPGGKYHRGITSGKEHVVAKDITRKVCDLERLEEQVGEWLYEGACTRTVGKTVFNERSSRSHAVATLHITWEEGGSETRLYLVDLAGSERAGQYALSAEQLKQGVNINKSLSTMARVITTMASGAAEHVPYRDSALTWLLSDAITGHKARAFMVAAINPSHLPETLSTLRYAQQYSSLQSNQEEINKVGSHVRKSLAQLQAQRSHFKDLIKQANWTRATLAARKALNQHETAQTRHFFGLLRDLEDAEARHAMQQAQFDDVIKKNKAKEENLIIDAD
jgi:kinesin family protein 1